MKHLPLFISAFFLLLLQSAGAQTLKPTDKLALLKGMVTNMKGKPLNKETVLLVNDQTKTTVQVNTDANGKFEVLAPISATYSLKYKAFTSNVDYTKMVIPGDKDATYEVLIKIDPPKNFVLENVYFETGKSALKPNSFKALNDLVEVLKLKSTMVVEIQGHTDNVGQEEDNLKLSQERANEVKKYLISKGISDERVTAKGYGPSVPIADNATDAGKAKNRRTSLKVIKE
ncbi:MAG: OmpA family protein [bacterium]|nr:OmpA family protein [bacterium]